MIYGPYSFSSNGDPTIVRADGNLYSVQRSALLCVDMQGVKNMNPAAGTSPNYIDGEYYTIDGLTVLRNCDKWYCYTSRGWKALRQYNAYWLYA